MSPGPNIRPSSQLDSLLSAAVELHKKGDLPGAVKGYERAVKLAPEHPGLLQLLGLAYFQSGEAGKAEPLLKKAFRIEPRLPGAPFNLGLVLQSLQRYEEAASYFEKAIFANRNDIEAHINLAIALTKLGRKEAAKVQFKAALALDPKNTVAHLSLGDLEIADKNNEAAAFHFRQALSAGPPLIKAIEAYVGLIYSLRELGRNDEAIKLCEEAVARAPENVELQFHYAAALHAVGRYEDAMQWHRRVIPRMGNVAMAHFNCAVTCYALNAYEDTLSHYRRALDLGLPADFAVTAELQSGATLQTLGRDEEADRIFDRVIEDQGDSPDGKEAKKLKSLLHLNRGDFTVGWPLYNRYRTGKDTGALREPPPFPEWRGERLEQTLWIWAEQGLGDQILYASMIDDARARASSIVVEVEPRLVTLFARSFPGVRVVPFGTDLAREGIGAQISLPGLGQYFRGSWDAFPKRDNGFLVADQGRTDQLRARLYTPGGKIVGVSWRSVGSQFSRHKTARLTDFLPVLRMPDVRFVDLQHGDTAAERAEFEAATGIEITHFDDVDSKTDIDGLAALVSACDAVVSISNTNAHLAGALGKQTFVFVPFGYSQIWYWFGNKSDSPWYPRVRVNYQSSGQPWESAVSLAAPAIDEFLRSK